MLCCRAARVHVSEVGPKTDNQHTCVAGRTCWIDTLRASAPPQTGRARYVTGFKFYQDPAPDFAILSYELQVADDANADIVTRLASQSVASIRNQKQLFGPLEHRPMMFDSFSDIQ